MTFLYVHTSRTHTCTRTSTCRGTSLPQCTAFLRMIHDRAPMIGSSDFDKSKYFATAKNSRYFLTLFSNGGPIGGTDSRLLPCRFWSMMFQYIDDKTSGTGIPGLCKDRNKVCRIDYMARNPTVYMVSRDYLAGDTIV